MIKERAHLFIKCVQMRFCVLCGQEKKITVGYSYAILNYNQCYQQSNDKNTHISSINNTKEGTSELLASQAARQLGESWRDSSTHNICELHSCNCSIIIVHL